MNYMVCYSKDAVNNKNHKKPYFICLHYQLSGIYIHVANVGAMMQRKKAILQMEDFFCVQL